MRSGTHGCLAWVLACAAVLPSCASYEPKPLVPMDELEQLRRRTIEGLSVVHARPGEAGAQAARFDPTDGLDEAEIVAVALTLNPELRARRLAIGEAHALLVQAGVWPNPELGVKVRPGLEDGNLLAAGVDLLLRLLRPGETAAKRAIAEARIDAARQDVLAEELRIAALARRARLDVLAAEHVVRLLQQEAALRDEAVTMVGRQREIGEATALDQALVDLERASVRRELRLAEYGLETSRRSLNAVLGLPPDHRVPLAGGLTFVVHEGLDDEELDRRLLAGRFDLRAKEADYRAAEQELRLAVLRQVPWLKIGPSFERDIDGTKSLGPAAAIELPLFDRNQGEIAAKEAQRERSRAEWVSMLHRLRAQAFEARATVRRARSEVEVQQQEIELLLTRAEALFEGAFRARELTVFEWMTARSRAVQTRREQLRALVRYTNAVVELEAATGMPLSRPVPDELREQRQQR